MQIHAHRIVRPVGRLLGLGLGRDLPMDLDQLAALALGLFVGLVALLLSLFARLLSLFARLLGLDDVDAHLAEHGENILDLFGIDLLRAASTSAETIVLPPHASQYPASWSDSISVV